MLTSFTAINRLSYCSLVLQWLVQLAKGFHQSECICALVIMQKDSIGRLAQVENFTASHLLTSSSPFPAQNRYFQLMHMAVRYRLLFLLS